MDCLSDILQSHLFQGIEILIATIATVVSAYVAVRTLPKIKKDVAEVGNKVEAASEQVEETSSIYGLKTVSKHWESDGVMGHYRKRYEDGLVAKMHYVYAHGGSASLQAAQDQAARAMKMQKAGQKDVTVYGPDGEELGGRITELGKDPGLEADAWVEELRKSWKGKKT